MSFGAGKIADDLSEIPDGGVISPSGPDCRHDADGVIAEAGNHYGHMARIGVSPVVSGGKPDGMLIATLPPERSDGPTPNGGAYALAYFSKAGCPVLRGEADAVEIVEYTADGHEIFRTYGLLLFPPADGSCPLPSSAMSADG